MDISRQRAQNRAIRQQKLNKRSNDDFIVRSNQFILTKVITIILTVLISFYSLTVFYFFISAIFNINNNFISVVKITFKISNADIIKFLLLSLLIFIVNFLILFIWKTYNKKRFGALNRRTMPSITTDEDILSLGLIDVDNYTLLQNEDLIIFEKNPIKDLNEVDKEN